MKTLGGPTWLAFALAAWGCAGAQPSAPKRTPPVAIDAGVEPVDVVVDGGIDEANPPSAAPALDAATEAPREPQTIVTGLDAVESIALDDTDAYVLTHPPGVWRLLRVPKRGGAVVRLDDFHAEAVSLALDDQAFYVSTAIKISEAIQGGNFRTSAYGRVIAASKVGGARATIFDGLRAAYGVAVSGARVYWLSGAVDPTGGVTIDAVMRGRASGGGAAYLAMKQIGVTSVATDDANAFFTVAGRFDERKHAWPPGAVMRAPVTGTAAITIATTGEQPRAIALDEAAVYWIERDGALMRASKSGGAASLVADKVQHFVVDAARAYWSNGTTVAATAKAGGDPVARWTAAAPVTAVAADAAFVYYAAGGELRRAPK